MRVCRLSHSQVLLKSCVVMMILFEYSLHFVPRYLQSLKEPLNGFKGISNSLINVLISVLHGQLLYTPEIKLQ
jgi:hypothetical protein